MDKRRLILLVGMLVLAPVIFILLRGMSQTEPAPVTETPQIVQPVVEKVDYTDVLVASNDFVFGSRLNETHFTWKQWPSDAVSPNYITRETTPQAMTELSGAVARADFFAGDPLTARKLVMPGESSVMSALLAPGMRAVTTRISVDTAAGGFIQPGDRVDIILTSSISEIQGSSKRYTSDTIFENVRVLAIDQTFSSQGQAGAFVIGSTATFEMTQRDAEVLQQSVAQGDLSLTLRPIGKSSAPGTSRATSGQGSGEVSSLTIYRDGQPSQVAIRGK
ncbi:MAG: Flp pilus assembly protein CpaB [Hellea sp.]|nr:Flp pilus assembly protein CpaB [Hellea sp.]